MIGAAILAGGRARRLGGAQKALVELGGRTILQRQTAVLSSVAEEILLVVGDREIFRAADLGGAKLVTDVSPGRGPLAGLEAAFAASRADALLVVGCDLPFLDDKLLAHVRDAAPDAEAVVPRVAGRPQPLHARFARAALPFARARLARNSLRLIELLDDLRTHFLDEAELRAIDAELASFTNVNTPEDLARARARVKVG